MGRNLSLDDPDHYWSRAQEARADAEWMPDPDTRRLTLAVAENYEQLARHLEVRARRQRQPQRLPDGHLLGDIAGRSEDEGHAQLNHVTRPSISLSMTSRRFPAPLATGAASARAMSDRYTIVVHMIAAAADIPPFKPWAWEICRDGKRLPVRLRENGFQTEHTATLAGKVALGTSCLVSRKNRLSLRTKPLSLSASRNVAYR
jgi:hypothetical protein